MLAWIFGAVSSSEDAEELCCLQPWVSDRFHYHQNGIKRKMKRAKMQEKVLTGHLSELKTEIENGSCHRRIRSHQPRKLYEFKMSTASYHPVPFLATPKERKARSAAYRNETLPG